MSVVNDMLKDLQRRRADNEQTVSLDGLVTPAPPMGERLRALKWAVLGGVVSLAAAGGWQWVNRHRAPTLSAVTTAALAPSSSATPTRVKPPPMAPAHQAAARPAPKRPADKALAGATKPTRKGAATASTATVVHARDAVVAAAIPTQTRAAPVAPAAGHTPASHATTPNHKSDVGVHGRAKPHQIPVSGSAHRSTQSRPQTHDGMTKQMVPLSRHAQAQQLYRKAVERLQRGDLMNAENLLRRALTLAPNDPDARAALAALLLQQKRPTQAAALLVAGLRNRPRDPDYAELYGRLLAGEGHTKQAVIVMEKALPGAADDPAFHALLAALYQRLGRNGEAAAQYRSALSSVPTEGVWWMGLGISLENLHADQQAVAAYRQALALPGLDNRLRDYVAGRLRAASDAQDEQQVTP